MAIDLTLRAKGILCKLELNFPELLKKTRLKFGNYTPFFVLDEENTGLTGILYNPRRMSRGIYFDGTNMHRGEVKLSINLPTTPTEIDDFLRVVTEVKLQYRSMDIISKDVTLSTEEFVDCRSRYLDYSLKTLRGFCETRQYEAAILTLAAYPYTLTPDEMVHFAKDGTLEDFEALLHEKQIANAHYACPKLMRRDGTEDIVAFYTLAEDLPAIMPVECSCFLSLEQYDIAYGLVRFYLESEDRVLDGYFDYDNFIAVLLEFGAEYFDGDHLILPAFTAVELKEIAEEIKAMPPKQNVIN